MDAKGIVPKVPSHQQNLERWAAWTAGAMGPGRIVPPDDAEVAQQQEWLNKDPKHLTWEDDHGSDNVGISRHPAPGN